MGEWMLDVQIALSANTGEKEQHKCSHFSSTEEVSDVYSFETLFLLSHGLAPE